MLRGVPLGILAQQCVCLQTTLGTFRTARNRQRHRRRHRRRHPPPHSTALQLELADAASRLTRSSQEVERLKGELRTSNAAVEGLKADVLQLERQAAAAERSLAAEAQTSEGGWVGGWCDGMGCRQGARGMRGGDVYAPSPPSAEPAPA